MNEIIIKEAYLDILRNKLFASIKKFGFIDPVKQNKFYCKYYQDSGSKHKHHIYYVTPGDYKTAPKLLIFPL